MYTYFLLIFILLLICVLLSTDLCLSVSKQLKCYQKAVTFTVTRSVILGRYDIFMEVKKNILKQILIMTLKVEINTKSQL